MLERNVIKRTLENAFDIPFDVDIKNDGDSPEFRVRPSENIDYLFDIRATFSNRIRFVMTFEPQKYGAEMVREMGHSSEEQKKIFLAYAKEMLSHGAKTTLKINDMVASTESYESWPDEWHKVDLKSAIIPIEYDADDEPDYNKTVLRWIPLMMGISLSLLSVEKIEEDEQEGFEEGKKYDVVTTKYERNPNNRLLCLSKYGYKCQICGFDFWSFYGEIGSEFIHVHHKIPVSKMGEGYIVNPEMDLIPVCPNCHAMLHRTNPPIEVEKLKEIVVTRKGNK